MADNDTPETQVSQTAVLEGGVSDPYEMRPTAQIDLERRQAEEAKTGKDKLKERTEATLAALGTAHPDAANTDSVGEFRGTDPVYQNYGGVSHEPMNGDAGPEVTAEEKLLAAQAGILENSIKAQGGHSTYGESVEVDPLGRSGAIVRGGSGDENTARGVTTPSSSTPQSSPEKAAAAAKKAAPAKE